MLTTAKNETSIADTGLVVARYRHRVDVEDDDGRVIECALRNRRLKPLVGDLVQWRSVGNGTSVVEAIEPRRCALMRIDSRGRAEGVAANLTRILIVTASEPAPDWHLVDRYLVAAELMDIGAMLVCNKVDRPAGENHGRDAVYGALGYAALETSAKTGVGIDALADRIRGERCVLVGQSGVGKSSLINALTGADMQRVGELGAKGRHGRHTTTTAVLYRLANDAELIDTPGVRNYAPYIEDASRIDRSFREFVPLIGRCRFDDCHHDNEPECAIKNAVDQGEIDAERYASYIRLRTAVESSH